MCGTHARQQSHTPRIFTSITRRNSSTGISWNGRSSSELKTAALLTRTSIRPKAFMATEAVKAFGRIDGGVVDQDVDSTESLHGLGRHALGIALARHVDFEPERPGCGC